jgi:putative endonuclease
MAKHNVLGAEGEEVAAEFLESKGFKIVDRNWSRPFGELDIVARGTDGYRFVEVKSVSWETGVGNGNDVSHETRRPEENVSREKSIRLMRTIQAYIATNSIEDDWQFDTIAVFLDQKKKKAKVRHLEDIVLQA